MHQGKNVQIKNLLARYLQWVWCERPRWASTDSPWSIQERIASLRWEGIYVTGRFAIWIHFDGEVDKSRLVRKMTSVFITTCHGSPIIPRSLICIYGLITGQKLPAGLEKVISAATAVSHLFFLGDRRWNYRWDEVRWLHLALGGESESV